MKKNEIKASNKIISSVMTTMLDKWHNKRIEIDFEGGVTIVELKKALSKK